MMESKYVQNTYERIGNEFSTTRYNIWPCVRDFLEDKTRQYGLDIGCGNGKNMIIDKMIGVDNCYKFIEICKSKQKDVILSDVCNLPFNDNIFDFTICIATLHHLSSDQRREKCLLEMIRVLKVGVQGQLSVWSQEYQDKYVFDIGDNYVPWKSRTDRNQVFWRYYFIMNHKMFTDLIDKFHSYIDIKKIKNEKGNWIVVFTKKKHVVV